MTWTTLCELSDLSPNGEGTFVQIGHRELAVFLDDGVPRVTDNLCPHAGGSMAAGYLEKHGDAVCAVCPWHGWAFRVDTGEMPDLPGYDLAIYEARIETTDGGKTVVAANLP